MKREAQPALSVEGQQALGLYAETLRQIEDLSTVTIRNYLSDLRQFMVSPHDLRLPHGRSGSLTSIGTNYGT